MNEPEAPESDQNPNPDQGDGNESGEAQDGASSEGGAPPAFSQELAKIDNAPFGEVVLGGLRLRANAVTIQLPERLSIQGFMAIWEGVDSIRDRSKWWQGDLLNAGHGRFGDKVENAMEHTGNAYQSFANNASICRKYTPEQRHALLSYSHHAIVASMPADEREALLQRAENEKLNTEQIRAEFREWKAERDAAAAGNTPPGSLDGASRTPTQSSAPAEHRGVKPVDPSELPEGEQGWICAQQGCENLVFDIEIYHCLDCGAHYAVEDESGKEIETCPYCPAAGAVGSEGQDGPVTPAPPQAASGLVIPPDNGHDESVTLRGLVGMVSIREMDIADAVEAIQSEPTALASLMALGEWITRVIEAATSEAPAATPPVATGRPLSPAPKPSGKKARRTVNQAPPAEEAETEDAEEEAPFI